MTFYAMFIIFIHFVLVVTILWTLTTLMAVILSRSSHAVTAQDPEKDSAECKLEGT